MTHPSKIKGNSYERELVNHANSRGLVAERAYASNGKALGECEEVDVIISGMRVQAKRRKKLAALYKLSDGVDAVVFREDRGESFILVRLDDMLDIIKDRGGW
jgi:Holliday junction resolvase